MPRVSQHTFGVIVASLCLVGLASPGQAAEPAAHTESGTICPICQRAQDEHATYPSKAGYTLVRGATNTLFGWTEVIRQPADEVKAGGNVFAGIAHGVGRGIGRTLAGAGEVLTFWTPKVQNSYVHFADDCPICMGKRRAQPSTTQTP